MDWLSLVRRGNVTLYGMSLFSELERQSMGTRELSLLLTALDDGRLGPEIDREVSWRDLGPALEALRDRRVAGKVVAIVD